MTIVPKRAVLADGLSTGVFLLGPEQGMALIERLPDVEGVIVGADNQVLVSTGLRSGSRCASPPRTDSDGEASGLQPDSRVAAETLCIAEAQSQGAESP